MVRILRPIIGGIMLLTVAWHLFSEGLPAAPRETGISSAARNPASVAAEVDRFIEKRLAQDKITAAPLADDAEFHRRATLDITGRIPTAEHTAAFLKSTDPAKRATLIDELLADHEYGEHFAIIWYHRIVKLDDDNRYLVAKNHLQDWLTDNFNKSNGWDRIVTDLLTAQGDRDKHPETVFYMAHVDDNKTHFDPAPNKVTAAATRLFLGVKLECCECHNHPFSTLKQTDFWGVAAFFGNTHAEHSSKAELKKDGTVPSIHEGAVASKGPRKAAQKPTAKDKDKDKDKASLGSIAIPDSKGQKVRAKFLGGEQPSLAGKKELRPVFANWATSPKNPYFARAAVNKMWANFFGRGIINPVDDMDDESKNSHPEILKLLSDEFVASGYDLKHLIRCICNSTTYQRTSQVQTGNKSDDTLYSHMQVKVMSADMLYDSLAVALGHSAAAQPAKPEGKKKGGGGPREQFRKFFHAEADDDVGVVEDYTHGIPQVLRLLNSRQVNDTSGTVTRLLKAGGGSDKIIEGLYLTVLSRMPTDAETKRMKTYAAGVKEPAKGYGDLMWVLLNSGEFMFNH